MNSEKYRVPQSNSQKSPLSQAQRDGCFFGIAGAVFFALAIGAFGALKTFDRDTGTGKALETFGVISVIACAVFFVFGFARTMNGPQNRR